MRRVSRAGLACRRIDFGSVYASTTFTAGTGGRRIFLGWVCCLLPRLQKGGSVFAFQAL